jgi:3'(2'), 5'-bisphosphate nucleotidase
VMKIAKIKRAKHLKPQVQCKIDTDNLKHWLIQVENLLSEASKEVLDFYNQEKPVAKYDKEDKTPVTEADLRIDAVLREKLPSIANFPMVTEETFSLREEVSLPESYWLVDPIDGTQNFINKDDEFSIIISLVIDHLPVLGAIAVPAKDIIYSAYFDGGATKIVNGKREKLSTRFVDEEIRVATSKLPSQNGRQASNQLLVENSLEEKQLIRVGSAYKQGLLAEGVVDLLICYDRMWEWDIAAGVCILREVNCFVFDHQTLEPLEFGKNPERKFSGYLATVGDLSFYF